MKALAVVLSMIALVYAQAPSERPSTCASVSCIALAGVTCKEVLNPSTGIIQGQCINNFVPTGNEQVCKDGQPLYVAGASGPREASCGRSTNRIDCPKGYSCNIHPADAYAVCCPDPGPEMCTEPPKVGPCKAYIVRYFYNTTSRQCQKFGWGGCEPNFNNFLSLEECQGNCIKDSVKPGQCPAIQAGEVGICAFMCQQDGECSGDQKCCPTACGGTSCTPPASTATCTNNSCGPEQTCTMIQPQCFTTPCDPIPQCTDIPRDGQCPAPRFQWASVWNRPRCRQDCRKDSDCPNYSKCCKGYSGCGTTCEQPEPTNTCANTKCPKGQSCKMQEVTCIRAPCFPVPTCLDTASLCSPVCKKGYECQLQRPWYCYWSCDPRPTCVRSRTRPT